MIYKYAHCFGFSNQFATRPTSSRAGSRLLVGKSLRRCRIAPPSTTGRMPLQIACKVASSRSEEASPQRNRSQVPNSRTKVCARAMRSGTTPRLRMSPAGMIQWSDFGRFTMSKQLDLPRRSAFALLGEFPGEEGSRGGNLGGAQFLTQQSGTSLLPWRRRRHELSEFASHPLNETIDDARWFSAWDRDRA